MAKLNGLGKLARSALLGVVVLGLADGCTRRFYRHEADKEVSEVLGEKDKYPAWAIEQWYVYPDPHARFADPTNPDRPPKPPDDPAAFDMAPNPQKPGHAGVERIEGAGYLDLLVKWDAENRAQLTGDAAQTQGDQKPPADTPATTPAPTQPPAGSGTRDQTATAAKPADKAESAPQDKSGYTTTILSSPVMPGVKPKPGQQRPYLINLEQAVELAGFNSREFQDAREDLYMTALPVTLERFSFAAQFFAMGEAVRQWAGSAAGGNNWQLNSNVGFAKLFPTGALLLFNFANQTVLNLGGAAKPVTSESTINLDLVQPLLQAGGRAVALEPLTQAERNLLYEIRNFARFRKTLYVAIAGGGGGALTGGTFQPTNVLAPISFSPTQGLGSSGLLPGTLPTPFQTGPNGLQTSPGLAGQIALQVALTAPVSGYLSTLLQAAQMQVDRYNIEKLEEFFNLAKALQEGGDISQLQTDTFEQALLGGRQSLLTDQQNYLQTLDQFKLQLGLPTDLLIQLDDTPFRPLNAQFQRYEDLFHQFDAASKEPLDFRAPEMAPRLRGELKRILTSSDLVKETRFRTTIEPRWREWERMSADDLGKRLATLRAERRRLEDKQTDLETKGQALSAADQQRLDDVRNDIDLGELERALRDYEAQPWKNVLDQAARIKQQRLMHGYVVNAFLPVLIEARNERMKTLHEKWPTLSRVCVDGVDLMTADLDDAEAAAARHGLLNRLDLMNVRGQLVDAWRQIAIFANALLAPLDVEYRLTSTTPPAAAMPLNFNEARTQQQLVLNTSLPLVRINQRNNYRAALINYQRARRILQRAEDEVQYDTRQELILLRQGLENYKIQTRQVELAYLTVENALDTLQAPPAGGAAAVDTATRAASLTNQLIMAQRALYTAHFTMTTIWITYLNTRDQLYRDMELMPLDSRGVWIDETDTCECPDGARRAGGQPAGPAPGGGPVPGGGERPEQLPKPQPGPTAQGAAVEQAH